VSKSPKYAIASIQPVGRYALGVTWQDKHDSIFPFTSLRRLCPCLECEKSGAATREPREPERKLEGLLRIEDASVMLHWGDGHETLFLVEELRELCGCAACKGEPNYPITGQ
jgi:DUF971 family protein